MGGLGSGRTSYTQKAEQCRSLDVNRLNREGCLRPGWRGGWQWSSDGEEVARIDLQAELGRVILDFRVRQNGGDWHPIKETVPIEWADCNYGGHGDRDKGREPMRRLTCPFKLGKDRSCYC